MTLCNLPSFTLAMSALNSGGWDDVLVMKHKHLIFHLHWLFESTPLLKDLKEEERWEVGEEDSKIGGGEGAHFHIWNTHPNNLYSDLV